MHHDKPRTEGVVHERARKASARYCAVGAWALIIAAYFKGAICYLSESYNTIAESLELRARQWSSHQMGLP